MKTLEEIEQIISNCGNDFELIGEGSLAINDTLFFYDDLDKEWNSGKSLRSLLEETVGLDEFGGCGYYIDPTYNNNLPPLSEVEIWCGYYNDPVFGDISIDVLKYKNQIVIANYSCD